MSDKICCSDIIEPLRIELAAALKERDSFSEGYSNWISAGELLRNQIAQLTKERDEAREQLEDEQRCSNEVANRITEVERQRDSIQNLCTEATKQITHLRAQLAELTEIHTTSLQLVDEVGRQRDKRREEAASLRAQLAELQADKDRLDWLEANPFMAYRDRDLETMEMIPHFCLVDEDECRRRKGRVGIVKPTLRTAIDTARGTIKDSLTVQEGGAR